MTTCTGTLETEITSLSPEILLKIFLNLESHETVILRSVCKEFVEIIDNNKSLWRVLDWIQEKSGSAVQALEKFDEKSGSTLKEVSIVKGTGESDHEHLLKVLGRSKNTSTDLSLKLCSFDLTFLLKLIELASSFHSLNTLVLWASGKYSSLTFPRTRLTRRCEHFPLTLEKSNNLQVLWCLGAVNHRDWKLDVSSLVSFADSAYYNSLQIRSFIIKFSSTLVHLSIESDKGVTTPPLSCPSLRILEGRFGSGFPSWLDAANLQIVIASDVGGSFIQGLPVSVQELWVSYSNFSSLPAKFWETLPLVCPVLKIMKIDIFFLSESLVGCFLVASRSRQAKVKEGAEIKGIKMVSLEKLIIPTELFKPVEIHDLREMVGEVMDIKDYPDFVELEY